MARAATKAKAKPAAKKKPAPKIDDAAATLKALHDDPVLFVKTCLNATPQAWQTDALQAVRDHDRVAISSRPRRRQVGVSKLGDLVVATYALPQQRSPRRRIRLIS